MTEEIFVCTHHYSKNLVIQKKTNGMGGDNIMGYDRRDGILVWGVKKRQRRHRLLESYTARLRSRKILDLNLKFKYKIGIPYFLF